MPFKVLRCFIFLRLFRLMKQDFVNRKIDKKLNTTAHHGSHIGGCLPADTFTDKESVEHWGKPGGKTDKRYGKNNINWKSDSDIRAAFESLFLVDKKCDNLRQNVGRVECDKIPKRTGNNDARSVQINRITENKPIKLGGIQIFNKRQKNKDVKC